MDPDLKLLLFIILAVVLGVVAWQYKDEFLAEPEATPSVELPAAPNPEPQTGPRYPMPEAPAEQSTDRQLVPLPALDDSDGFFLLEFANAFGPAMESLLVRDAVIDRLVATIDSLPRKQLPATIRPVRQLETPFRPDAAAETMELGPTSFARYDPLVRQIASADLDAVYDTYQRFYPLFQKAYRRLGYPQGYFNDRLVEVIDHLIAAPEHDGPIYLTRPKVLYEYADPDLEALSSGHKLMLRLGPGNAESVKRVLADFRNKIVS